MNMTGNQKIQELAYRFPYHYVPRLRLPDHVVGYQTWPWYLSYLVGLKMTHNWFAKIKKDAHVHLDIGCGDGALIHFLRQLHSDVQLIGTDYDEKAISWAKLFNPDVHFIVSDLISNPEAVKKEVGSLDSISLIEVAEHIDPEKLPLFLSNAVSLLKPRGHFLLTVPHCNAPLSPKHYQHFSFDSLKKQLPDDLSVSKLGCFEYLPLHLRMLKHLLKNRAFYCEIPILERIFFRSMESSYSDIENSHCRRIILTGRKRD